jgi:SAM-dependent methyltransferase
MTSGQPATALDYQGGELELFAHAANWKRYLERQVRPYLGSSVLEVGAGLGGTTQALYRGQDQWLCLEPDETMARHLGEMAARGALPSACRVRQGVTNDLLKESEVALFDSLIYMDVLEHIDDDVDEAARAIRLVRPGGHLVVLSPAFQWLYTEFDAAIGHVRRYDRAAMHRLTPPGTRLVRLEYLDSVGMLASLANRVLLKAQMPTIRQVLTWDRLMVPLSRLVDPVVGHAFGKSILGIWQRTE